jgi:CRISPR-associated endonuclease/helicase Cas3
MHKSTFWGKLNKNEDGKPLEWHSLVGHSADVAACVEALLSMTILNKRLAKLADLSILSTSQISRLSVLAALHDIGKYNTGFQAKCDPKLHSLWEGHQLPVLALFGSQTKEEGFLYEALSLPEILSWADDPEKMLQLIIACICHHGKPLRCTRSPDTSLWQDNADLKPFSGLQKLQHYIRNWFPEAFSNNVDKLPSNSEFHHAFAGIVTFADWLGSTVEFFPFDNGKEQGRMSFSRERAIYAVDKLFLNPNKSREKLNWVANRFAEIFGFPPRPCQDSMTGLSVPQEGSISILEGETGTGKTEAAMARFLHLFQSGVVDGLYFALPTRTAATQIYQRICETIKKAFPDEDSRPPVLLAVPGYIQVDGNIGKRLLPDFEVLWDDESEKMKYKGWASENPKRFLSGTIIVGTIDQILLSSLQVKHAHMRAACLLRHLIVVDEVHASDAYMNCLLENVLRHHIKAGGHALLMSATLGCSARIQFEKLFHNTVTPDYVESCRTPYPLITCHEVGKLSNQVYVKSNAKEKQIQITFCNKIDQPKEIVSIALKAAQKGAKVLIIRNTVRDAIRTQIALERCISPDQKTLLFQCLNVITLHHARFAKTDREVLDAAIELVFGKSRHKGGVIAVATQTVQQSLDLDADLIITDLCPMDVLLQRIGRLHRHERASTERPLAYCNPQTVVLVPERPDLSHLINKQGSAKGAHGFGTVYSDLRILQATWETLQKETTICIPSMNRQLVESATHPVILQDLALRYGEPWISHQNRVMGTAQAHKGVAQLNVINREIFFGDDNSLFPEASTTTRLGEGDRLISFTSPIISPFNCAVKTMTMPAWQADEIPSNAEVEKVITICGSTYFTWGGKEFIYDRLGLRPNNELQENEDDLDET